MQALDAFGRLRRWRGRGDSPAEIDRDELRAAAKLLRERVDQLAEMSTASNDSSSHLRETFGGHLLCLAAAHEEPWLLELAERLAGQIVATHAAPDRLAFLLLIGADVFKDPHLREAATQLAARTVDMSRHEYFPDDVESVLGEPVVSAAAP